MTSLVRNERDTLAMLGRYSARQSRLIPYRPTPSAEDRGASHPMPSPNSDTNLILGRLDDQREMLNRILDQAERTNGRVTQLEGYRSGAEAVANHLRGDLNQLNAKVSGLCDRVDEVHDDALTEKTAGELFERLTHQTRRRLRGEMIALVGVAVSIGGVAVALIDKL